MSKDDKDPYAMPGGDPFKKKENDLNPSAHDDIFQKGKAGGGGKPNPTPAQTNADDDLISATPPPPPPKVYPVKLFNPKWSSDTAEYGDTASFTLDIDLPESHAHLTRVSVLLCKLNPNGKKETITTLDAHAKNGKVDGSFTLNRPDSVKPGESCSFVFTGSHRECAKEVESSKLEVKEPERTIALELDDHAPISKEGHSLVLKSADGKIHSTLTAKDGADSDGVLTFEFKNLDAETKYRCELQNDKGEFVEIVFSETRHGDWGSGAETDKSSKIEQDS